MVPTGGGPDKLGSIHLQVVVAGLTNLYTQYIATPEEYRAQRYEAASTIYGDATNSPLCAYYKKLIMTSSVPF